MNVLILTDLEGISGVDYKEQVHDTNSDGYKYACERLMADTNAAVEGAKRAGADKVIRDDFVEERPYLTRIDARTVERVAKEIKTYEDVQF
ncbi:MAG: M55 family metallopeptidase [Oscillospiraceae bacterium]|nr:M55 family metallopeptidase [Oscillospiraceae bacterium]MBQ7053755.1 M55 family metallopeptidase [Oscillospiraceae bacterium]